MERDFYIRLANAGLRMPIGTDLVLHEKPDADDILQNGERLGKVIAESADRYRTPLAIGLMDLMLEKGALLDILGMSADGNQGFHFAGWPGDHVLDWVGGPRPKPLSRSMQVHFDAISWVARHTAHTPVGMTIGPFSLFTKLMADPITPVFMIGSGTGADEDADVALAEKLLEAATLLVLRSVDAQIRAGAKLIVVAEPAANRVFISPRQMEEGSSVFERLVMAPNRRLRERLESAGVDLFFHCCGELTEPMVRSFASLDPAILSLGSSRHLWEDAALVPKNTVLFGNLPSKRFYSDSLITAQGVQSLAREMEGKMRAAGHPFILGSECDVLNVKGSEAAIRAKVKAFMDA